MADSTECNCSVVGAPSGITMLSCVYVSAVDVSLIVTVILAARLAGVVIALSDGFAKCNVFRISLYAHVSKSSMDFTISLSSSPVKRGSTCLTNASIVLVYSSLKLSSDMEPNDIDLGSIRVEPSTLT